MREFSFRRKVRPSNDNASQGQSAAQFPKLTPHVIVTRCRAGSKHCKGYAGRARPLFTLDGLRVERRYALAAIASGSLTPVRDALFADDCQTWIAKNTDRAPAARARTRYCVKGSTTKKDKAHVKTK